MPWMSWSPKGDRLAYFVRTEKERTLIVQNVLTREDRTARADEVGRRAGVAQLLARRHASSRSPALRGGIGDIFTVNLDTEEVVNLTTDDFADFGADLFARRHVHRLHRPRQRQPEAVPARPRDEEEDAAHLRHPRRDGGAVPSTTTRWCSRRRPPIRPCRVEPEVAKNGNIYNIWTLDLKTGELRQYTDALGGNLSPIVLNDGKASRIAFVTLLQGRVRHPHARAQGAAAHRGVRRLRRSGADHRLPGAAARTRWWRRTARRKGSVREDVPRGTAARERRRHEQRRRVRRHADHASATCSATSSSTSSPRRSRSTARCRCATRTCRGGSSTRCRASRRRSSSTASSSGVFYDPSLRAAHQPRPGDGDAHDARRHARSASIRSTGIAASSSRAGSCRCSEQYNDPALQQYAAGVPAGALRPAGLPQRHAWSRSASRSSRRRRCSASSVRSPGNTMRLAYDVAPKIGSTLVAPDASTATSATTCGSARAACSRTRLRGFKSIGRLPRLHLLRRQLGDARLRLPRVRRARTPSSRTRNCASR